MIIVPNPTIHPKYLSRLYLNNLIKLSTGRIFEIDYLPPV